MIFLRFLPNRITDRWQTGTIRAVAFAEVILVDVPLVCLLFWCLTFIVD